MSELNLFKSLEQPQANLTDSLVNADTKPPKHTIEEYKDLSDKNSKGEFHLDKKGNLSVSNTNAVSNKFQFMNKLTNPNNRQRAMDDFKLALTDYFNDPAKANEVFDKACGGKKKLDTSDLNKIWTELGPLDRKLNDSDKQQIKTDLAKVAGDERLHQALERTHPGTMTALYKHGLKKPKNIVGSLPVVSTVMKGTSAVVSNTEKKMLKSLREDNQQQLKADALVDTTLTTLEKHYHQKRNNQATGVALDVVKTAATTLTGGLSELVMTPIAMAGEYAIGKTVETGLNKGGDMEADAKVKGDGLDDSVKIGDGDNVSDLDDYKTARGLLLYLGPKSSVDDIKKEINQLKTASGDNEAKIEALETKLEQEEARVELKKRFGSDPSEDLVKRGRFDSPTEDDKAWVADLTDRKKVKADDGLGKYTKMKETNSDEFVKPSLLRGIFLAEGWITDDSLMREVKHEAKELIKQKTMAVKDMVIDVHPYGKFEDELSISISETESENNDNAFDMTPIVPDPVTTGTGTSNNDLLPEDEVDALFNAPMDEPNDLANDPVQPVSVNPVNPFLDVNETEEANDTTNPFLGDEPDHPVGDTSGTIFDDLMKETGSKN
ncbi:MAG: hypothetical protein AAGE89_05730 [Pseudomonadota bacterium]